MLSSNLLEAKEAISTSSHKYYISYATMGIHSFIVLTKAIEINGKIEYCVLGSFGLYGETDYYFCQIACCGAFSEHGRIRSDSFHLFNSHNVGISYKTYEISSDKAILAMRTVQEDAKINAVDRTIPKPATTKTGEDKKKEEEKKNFIDTHLTEEEKKFSSWIKEKLPLNRRGGPSFNGRDYNCKKYALQFLRRIEIRDPAIEQGRFPFHNKELTTSSFNIKNSFYFWNTFESSPTPNSIQGTFPSSYYELFNQDTSFVGGALKILDDYANDGLFNRIFHPKRHYSSKVRQIINDIKKAQAGKIALTIKNGKTHKNNLAISLGNIIDFVKYLKSELDISNPYRDITGSLARRLDFLEHMTDPTVRHDCAIKDRLNFERQNARRQFVVQNTIF